MVDIENAPNPEHKRARTGPRTEDLRGADVQALRNNTEHPGPPRATR
ncbi:hypothetical protein [Arthrobacter sp. MMS18-M83]|nr:hypothetical protein [Arthrobacter sp. MMS18-M83]WAH98233.1 hypothetical protein OW521_04985 [Arthrobacter sp. MMS18-M83]